MEHTHSERLMPFRGKSRKRRRVNLFTVASLSYRLRVHNSYLGFHFPTDTAHSFVQD